jgi:hypothetical protein
MEAFITGVIIIVVGFSYVPLFRKLFGWFKDDFRKREEDAEWR